MMEYITTQKKEIDELVRRYLNDDFVVIVIKWFAANGDFSRKFTGRMKEQDSIKLTDVEYRYATNIIGDGDRLSFDAALLCHFETCKNTDGRELRSVYKLWLTIQFTALLGVYNMVIYFDTVKPGRPERKKRQGNTVDSNLVPYISKRNLDTEAERFLEKYCPEALQTPMAVPIYEIITTKMGLDVRLGGVLTDSHNVFGQICFSDMTVRQVCFQSGQIFENNAPRGTILVDYRTCKRGEGCVNNTCAHEAFHWDRHQIYGTIRDLLHGEKYIACRRNENKLPQNAQSAPTRLWADEDRIEWQASSIAPRILMPAKTFKMKVDELYAQYGYAFINNYTDRTDIIASVINDLANFFKVSKQSAKIRMLDMGYTEAAAVYNYKNNKRRTDTTTSITQAEAFREYCENIEFRLALDSGKFRYVGNSFVIDHGKYVKADASGIYALTDYARANMGECALRFSIHKERPDLEDARRSGIAYRMDTSKLTEKIRYEDDASVTIIDNAEALLRLREDFDAVYSNHTAITQSFAETARTLMQRKKWNSVIFKSKTHLDDSMYSRLVNNSDRLPSFRSAVAICVGLGVDAMTANRMLTAAGYSFGQSKEHQAFCYLFSAMRGRSIDECNAFLESLSLKPLGNLERKPAEAKSHRSQQTANAIT